MSNGKSNGKSNEKTNENSGGKFDEQQLMAFKSRLQAQIPLVSHMGLKSVQFDGQALSLAARLKPNTNDKGTAFAGALGSIATLCGWSLITLTLEHLEQPYDVAIRDSRLEYLLPVVEDFEAQCQLPEPEVVSAFLQRLQERGKARLDLVVEIRQQRGVALRLSGAYVALKRKQWV